MLLTTKEKDAEELSQRIQANGLQEFEAEIIEQARTSCLLVGIEEVEPSQIGTTKFGGSPDLPNSFDRNKIDDLVFILQVNFEELQTFAEGLDLPDKGLLSLFSDREGQGCDTFFFPEQELFRQPMPHYDCFSDMKSWTVDFERAIDLPSYGTLLRKKIEDAGFEEAYDKLANEGYEKHAFDAYFAQMLGLHSEMEWDTRQLAVDECQGELDDWQVLWKIHSSDRSGVAIGDCHQLYGMIRKTDFIAKKFGRACSFRV